MKCLEEWRTRENLREIKQPSFWGPKAPHCTTMQLVIRQAAEHLCIGLLPARLHLRERVGDWTPDHVAGSFEDFAPKDDNVLRRLRRVCVYFTAHKRAVLRDSMEGYK